MYKNCVLFPVRESISWRQILRTPQAKWHCRQLKEFVGFQCQAENCPRPRQSARNLRIFFDGPTDRDPLTLPAYVFCRECYALARWRRDGKGPLRQSARLQGPPPENLIQLEFDWHDAA